jgi:hypothetical protein
MNVYLICQLARTAEIGLVFRLFSERFELEIESARQATVAWCPLRVEDAEIAAASRATLFVGEDELTWTLSGRPFSGRPSLARWSNFLRVGSVAMELVRSGAVVSWRLWSEVYTFTDSPDPRYVLAAYPPPSAPGFVVVDGAAFHEHAPVLAWEQENALRLDVSLDRHPLLQGDDASALRGLFRRESEP